MDKKPFRRTDHIKKNIAYLLIALLVSCITLLTTIYSLNSTSENLFRLELQTTLLVFMHALFFLISIVLATIILQIDKKYSVAWLIFSLIYVALLYVPFLKIWIDIFQYQDYGIVPIALIKLLIPLTLVQVIWSALWKK